MAIKTKTPRIMTTKNIIQSLDWDSIFGNSSQTDNLYDLLKGDIDLDVFINGFYPRCKNKKIAKHLTARKLELFKFHAKKLWNMSNVGNFGDGSESDKRIDYINNL
jgi:hypothetical protein